MRINHNISALQTNAHMRRTDNALDKAMERLSSGFKINKASDDAASKVRFNLEEYLEKASAFGKQMLFLGDGMPVHREAIQTILGDRALFAPAHSAFLRPAAAAFLAWNKREQAVEYKDLSPLYLRPPQAERQKNLREMKT